MLLTVVSRQDPASVNIGAQLQQEVDWEEVGEFQGRPVRRYGQMLVATIEGMHLHEDHVDRAVREEAGVDFDAVVFASRHKAASGKPSLTVHPIGNWGPKAKHGGEARELVPSMPGVMTPVLHRLREACRDLPHDATFEATHHGPFLETPACFLEIGTEEDHWSDPGLGWLMADILLELAEDPPPLAPHAPVLLAVGGGHYAPRHTDLVRSYDCHVGHILPDYHLRDGVPAGMLEQAVRRTPGCNAYVLNKPMGVPHQEEVEDVLEGLGLLKVTEDRLEPR